MFHFLLPLYQDPGSYFLLLNLHLNYFNCLITFLFQFFMTQSMLSGRGL